jgi:fructose 1,6-bisphosphatase
MDPAVAELEFDEQPSEPFLFFGADLLSSDAL